MLLLFVPHPSKQNLTQRKEQTQAVTQDVWGGQRPGHSGEGLYKNVLTGHIEMVKTGPSGAPYFCFLMVMDSVEMLMFALKALSAIFCSLKNSLF